MSEGGFFAPESQGQQGFPGNSSGEKRSYRPIRTLMVSQLLDADIVDVDSPVQVDGHPVENAMLCVVIQEINEKSSAKLVRVWDSTGETEVRLSNFRFEGKQQDLHLNRIANLFGYFRVFKETKNFEVVRVDYEIPAYQFLYHEILAAREWFHFTGRIPIGQSGDATAFNGTGSATGNGASDANLFVAPNQAERILDIIKGADDNDDGAPQEYIAREMSISEVELKPLLNRLVESGQIYEINESYRCNE